MLIAWEICQWTVYTPKRWASILLDMSMSWNVTIMYLLTPRASKHQQVFRALKFFEFLTNTFESDSFLTKDFTEETDTIALTRVIYYGRIRIPHCSPLAERRQSCFVADN